MCYSESMSVGMAPMPVPPVKAPFPNSCPPASKPFPCHTFTRSSKSSTLSSATATAFDSTLGVANPFALMSFADPHPLNLYGSSFYKKVGGRGYFLATRFMLLRRERRSPDRRFGYQIARYFIPFQFSELAGGFLLPEACRPKIWLCYTET